MRRKVTKESVAPGSVAVEGQQMDLRIIEASYQPLHRCCRYRYEVMSDDSPYFGKVDFLFSDEALRHREVYRVILNEDPDFPRIAELIGPVAAD